MTNTAKNNSIFRTLLMIVTATLTFSYANASTHSEDGCIKCDHALRGDPSKGQELEGIRKLASADVANYERLASGLCSRLLSGTIDGQSVKAGLKANIYYFMKDNNISNNPTPGQAIQMLNKHKNKMKCSGKNFVIYAMDAGFGELMFEFLNDDMYDEEHFFDFNSVTYLTNKKTGAFEPMTVVDFIENVALLEPRISGTKNMQRIYREIKDAIVTEYEGKRFKELPASERAAYMELTE